MAMCAGERYYFGNMGKRNAGQLVLLGCWCSVLVAMGAGERMQQASWCYRCAEAVCWWLWVQPASMERMQGASWFY